MDFRNADAGYLFRVCLYDECELSGIFFRYAGIKKRMSAERIAHIAEAHVSV